MVRGMKVRNSLKIVMILTLISSVNFNKVITKVEALSLKEAKGIANSNFEITKSIEELKVKKQKEEQEKKEKEAKDKKEQEEKAKQEKLKEPFKVVKQFNIPKGQGRFKSYMDFRAITSTGSVQYKLQRSAVTGANGVRYCNGYPMIAVSRTFGNCGELVRVKFSGGKTEVFMIGDIKAGTNFAHPDGSVVEFIVSTNSVPRSVITYGSFDSVYGGTIVSIEKVVKK